jgi:hypothetical protein
MEWRAVADHDSFIREVTEEVRRDRLFGLWKKYAPFVIGALVAVVVVTAIMSWLDHRSEMAAREAGGRLLDASRAESADTRAAQLLDLADLSEGGLSAIAHLQAGAALAETGDRMAAADAFDAAADAAAAEGEEAIAALAEFRAILLRAPETGYLNTVNALSVLAEAQSPMRLLALEARAAAHIDNGEIEAARADLQAILGDSEATEATRQRARELAATLGPAPDAAAAG